MKALLIIDMQAGCFKPFESCYDTTAVIARINALAALFRSKGYKVIFIQHDGSYENFLVPGTDDWQLLTELDRQPSDLLVQKSANDSFYQTNLASVLQEHGIEELYITGTATDFCVDATVQSAHSKGYQVTVVADAHTTELKDYLRTEALIAHYNQVWKYMAPTKHRISVIPADEIRL
jgi:nicotinamidase-related amidase